MSQISTGRASQHRWLAGVPLTPVLVAQLPAFVSGAMMLSAGALLAKGDTVVANILAIGAAVAIIPAFVLDRRHSHVSQQVLARSSHPILLQLASTIITLLSGGVLLVGGYFMTSLGLVFTAAMTVLSWLIVQGAFVIQRVAALSAPAERRNSTS